MYPALGCLQWKPVFEKTCNAWLSYNSGFVLTYVVQDMNIALIVEINVLPTFSVISTRISETLIIQPYGRTDTFTTSMSIAQVCGKQYYS